MQPQLICKPCPQTIQERLKLHKTLAFICIIDSYLSLALALNPHSVSLDLPDQMSLSRIHFMLVDI